MLGDSSTQEYDSCWWSETTTYKPDHGSPCLDLLVTKLGGRSARRDHNSRKRQFEL